MKGENGLTRFVLWYKRQDMSFLERRSPKNRRDKGKSGRECIVEKKKRENDGREEKMRLESLK